MRNLLKRGTSGLIYAVLFISAILYSKESYVTLVSLFGLVCIWEFLKLLNFKNIIPYIVFISILFLSFSNYNSQLLMTILLVISLTGSIQLLIQLHTKKNNFPSNTIQKIDISIRYLLLSFAFLILLPVVNGEYQESIILSLVIFIWVNDSFAFLVGKNFGKRKLFESVSPKKTIEGFLGGVFFTVIAAIIISFNIDFLSITHWIVLSLIVSILGTTGDLVESKFKRQANIKDSGTIMPGHGGLLDRLDSLLFVAPFVYLYIHYII
ncbi:MAG: CDP-archaeol synthase [Flavobacteriaceae bacterium]